MSSCASMKMVNNISDKIIYMQSFFANEILVNGVGKMTGFVRGIQCAHREDYEHY